MSPGIGSASGAARAAILLGLWCGALLAPCRAENTAPAPAGGNAASARSDAVASARVETAVRTEAGGANSTEVADPRAELSRRALDHGVDQAGLAAILARIDRIEAQGLPVAPVYDRYLEGFSKGVPLLRIEAAVDQLAARLSRAATCVDAAFPGSSRASERVARGRLIDSGAYALGVGTPEDALLRTLRLASADHVGPEGAGAPVLTLGVLVLAGISPDRSLEVLQTAWVHGYRGEDLQRLGQDLAARSAGPKGPPDGAVDRILSMIRRGGDHDRVFRALDEMRGGPGPGSAPPGPPPGEDPAHHHGGDGHHDGGGHHD